MPSLSSLFRSKSSLHSDSNVRDLHIQVGSELAGNKPTQAQMARLRKQISAAQAVLTQLNSLVSALQENPDVTTTPPPPVSDIPTSSGTSTGHSPSSTPLSVAIHLDDLKRSTKALFNILRKHAPLPPTPTTLLCAAAAAPTPPRSDPYPAPLRLPPRNPPQPSSSARSTHPDTPSPFSHKDRGFLDYQLSQRHSLNSGSVPCYPQPSANRPRSLPLRARGDERSHTGHSPQFSTEEKTRKLRLMQTPAPLLDDERPLGVDELMSFLRSGNSMREL